MNQEFYTEEKSQQVVEQIQGFLALEFPGADFFALGLP